MPDNYSLPPEIASPSFAEQAAAAEFGRNYVPPAARDFQDRPPPDLRRPDDIDQDAIDEISRHRIVQPRTRVTA